jgi:hypothetical protein
MSYDHIVCFVKMYTFTMRFRSKWVFETALIAFLSDRGSDPG